VSDGHGDREHEYQEPDLLRTAVDEAASRPVGPAPDVAAVVGRIRGRRRRRAVLQAGGATAAVGAVVVAVAVVTVPFGGSGSQQAVTPWVKPITSSSTGATAGGPSPSAQPDRPGVVCGQPLTAQFELQGPGGVQVAVTGVHSTGPSSAPTIDVAVSAGQTLRIAGSPRQLGIQVVVLRDGVVVDRVGGALWPEDYQPKPGETGGVAAAARSWPIAAGQPHVEQISPSHWTACPGADWAAIRADPAAYGLVAIMPMPQVFGPDGPVDGPTDGLLGSPAAVPRF